jgi:hypothetical protein
LGSSSFGDLLNCAQSRESKLLLILGTLGGRQLAVSATPNEARFFSALFGSSSPKVTKSHYLGSSVHLVKWVGDWASF